MRPALMLLAAMGVVLLVILRLRAERPDLAMAAQKRGPDAPTWIFGHAEIIGGRSEPQPLLHVETELERFQRQRELYLQLYPRLGEVLQLDANVEGELYDLLARQGLDTRGTEPAPPQIQDQVAAEKDAALEQLLGKHTFRRFDEYRRMPAAGIVSRLNATFTEQDRIRGEAIWRLTVLIHENSIYGGKGPIPSSSFQTLPPTAMDGGSAGNARSNLPAEIEDSPRSQALIALARHEDHFRLEERWRRHIEQEAASFLTPVQFDALKRSHAETSQSWRRGIERMRAEAGLKPEVPETPESNYLGIIRRRIPIEGNIRTVLTVTVNGEPVHFEHTGPNREQFGFQAGSGLRVEAVPTLFDDGALEILLAYFETRRGKPRQLDQWSRIESPSSAAHDSVTETHRGLIEYNIQPTGISATALERR